MFVRKDISIVPNTFGFEVCKDPIMGGEERLRLSLQKGAYVSANDIFIFKFVGRNVGFALKTVRTPTGKIHRGHWYTPATQEQRDQLRTSFDQGISRVTLQNAAWVHIRRSNYGFFERELAILKGKIAKLRRRIPDVIDNQPRQDYRMFAREFMNGEPLVTS